MKSIAKLLAMLAIVLCLVTTMPALAFWGDHNRVQSGHPYTQFGTGRGAAAGALGGFAVSKLTHSRHSLRNSLIGAGVGAYLGHRRHYY